MNLQERIKLVDANNKNSNCVGTAFFVLEIIEFDSYIGPESTYCYLSEMKEVIKPQIEDLVLFINPRNNYVFHAAVLINNHQRQEIFHRESPVGRVGIFNLEDYKRENQPIASVVYYRKR